MPWPYRPNWLTMIPSFMMDKTYADFLASPPLIGNGTILIPERMVSWKKIHAELMVNRIQGWGVDINYKVICPGANPKGEYQIIRFTKTYNRVNTAMTGERDLHYTENLTNAFFDGRDIYIESFNVASVKGYNDDSPFPTPLYEEVLPAVTGGLLTWYCIEDWTTVAGWVEISSVGRFFCEARVESVPFHEIDPGTLAPYEAPVAANYFYTDDSPSLTISGTSPATLEISGDMQPALTGSGAVSPTPIPASVGVPQIKFAPISFFPYLDVLSVPLYDTTTGELI